MFYAQKTDLEGKFVADTAEACTAEAWLAKVVAVDRVFGNEVITLRDAPIRVVAAFMGTSAEGVYKVVVHGDAKVHEKEHGQIFRFVDKAKAQAKFDELVAALKKTAEEKVIADGN